MTRTACIMPISHFLLAHTKSSKIEHVICKVLLLHVIEYRNIADTCRKKGVKNNEQDITIYAQE